MIASFLSAVISPGQTFRIAPLVPTTMVTGVAYTWY
jgi:hypothetical protein